MKSPVYIRQTFTLCASVIVLSIVSIAGPVSATETAIQQQILPLDCSIDSINSGGAVVVTISPQICAQTPSTPPLSPVAGDIKTEPSQLNFQPIPTITSEPVATTDPEFTEKYSFNNLATTVSQTVTSTLSNPTTYYAATTTFAGTMAVDIGFLDARLMKKFYRFIRQLRNWRR
jgi:hypothetical protein